MHSADHISENGPPKSGHSPTAVNHRISDHSLISKKTSSGISRIYKSSKSFNPIAPCLVGDPYCSLSVTNDIGVVAGTLLGMITTFILKPSAHKSESKIDCCCVRGSTYPCGSCTCCNDSKLYLSGILSMPQAFADDAITSIHFRHNSILVITGAYQVSSWSLPDLKCVENKIIGSCTQRLSSSACGQASRLVQSIQRPKWLQIIETLFQSCASMQQELESACLLKKTEENSLEFISWEKLYYKCIYDTPTQYTACIAGTGSACLLNYDLFEPIEDMQRRYFNKLWKGAEMWGFIPIDFNGMFVLCSWNESRTGANRQLLIIDLLGASKLNDEAKGWSPSRKPLVHDFTIYRRDLPVGFRTARFFQSFFLAITVGSKVYVYDVRRYIFAYIHRRIDAKRTRLEESLWKMEEPPLDLSFDHTTIHSLKNECSCTTPYHSDSVTLLFANCLLRPIEMHDSTHRNLQMRLFKFWSRSSRRNIEAPQAASDEQYTFCGTQLPAKWQDAFPFFIYEFSYRAFTLCNAFFEFAFHVICQRNLHQPDSFPIDDEYNYPLRDLLGPDTAPPVRVYAGSRMHPIISLDTQRPDNLFLILDNSGRITLFSLFHTRALYTTNVGKQHFVTGWPYIIKSDKSLVALTTDSGILCLRLPPEICQKI